MSNVKSEIQFPERIDVSFFCEKDKIVWFLQELQAKFDDELDLQVKPSEDPEIELFLVVWPGHSSRGIGLMFFPIPDEENEGQEIGIGAVQVAPFCSEGDVEIACQAIKIAADNEMLTPDSEEDYGTSINDGFKQGMYQSRLETVKENFNTILSGYPLRGINDYFEWPEDIELQCADEDELAHVVLQLFTQAQWENNKDEDEDEDEDDYYEEDEEDEDDELPRFDLVSFKNPRGKLELAPLVKNMDAILTLQDLSVVVEYQNALTEETTYKVMPAQMFRTFASQADFIEPSAPNLYIFHSTEQDEWDDFCDMLPGYPVNAEDLD